MPVLPSFPRDARLARLGLVEGKVRGMTMSKHVQSETAGSVTVHILPDGRGTGAVSILRGDRPAARRRMSATPPKLVHFEAPKGRLATPTNDPPTTEKE